MIDEEATRINYQSIKINDHDLIDLRDHLLAKFPDEKYKIFIQKNE